MPLEGTLLSVCSLVSFVLYCCVCFVFRLFVTYLSYFGCGCLPLFRQPQDDCSALFGAKQVNGFFSHLNLPAWSATKGRMDLGLKKRPSKKMFKLFSSSATWCKARSMMIHSLCTLGTGIGHSGFRKKKLTVRFFCACFYNRYAILYSKRGLRFPSSNSRMDRFLTLSKELYLFPCLENCFVLYVHICFSHLKQQKLCGWPSIRVPNYHRQSTITLGAAK